VSSEGLRSLNHFSCFSFDDAWWGLAADRRRAVLDDWLARMRAVGQATHLYQVYPSDAKVDLLLWTAAPLADPGQAAEFFARYARAGNPHRDLIRPATALWGITGPSSYSKARSTQEVDPYTAERRRYLTVYPFVKTKEWYLLSQDARQGMMNEHMRLGKSYPQITQLLLYAFGLQDQEFVVVYETDDLVLFSDLVRELRSTEARRYTERDSPLFTAVHHPRETLIELWSPA
jgi:chlorite dismutase